MNSLKHPPTDAEAKQHFTPDFLAHIDAGKVVALFRQIDASSTTERFVLDSVETGQTPRELVGIVSGKEGRLHVGVVVDPDGSGRMSALLIKQAD